MEILTAAGVGVMAMLLLAFVRSRPASDSDREKIRMKAKATIARRAEEWKKENGSGKSNTQVKWNLLPKTVAVTGASGMVGRGLVRMLLEKDVTRVVCIDIRPPSPDMKFKDDRVVYVTGDITKIEDLVEAFKGVDTVFHIAALVGPFHLHRLYEKVNVQGTRNVIEACRRNGVKRLVDCSSPSTRFNGDNIRGACESDLEYASVHEYARTKAIGEKSVLTANSSDLRTCAVAPHQVYGDEDQLFLPSFVRSMVSGKLRVFGQGHNVVSFTHVDNICHGLILAAIALGDDNNTESHGEYFVVTDGDPLNLWDVLDQTAVALGLASIRKKMHIPVSILYGIAALGNFLNTILCGRCQWKVTKFTVNMLVIDRFFCIEKSKRLLGYEPIRHFREAWPSAVSSAGEKVMGEYRELSSEQKALFQNM